MFACPVRGGCGTCSFRCGRGPECCVCPACRVSDCGYGGDSTRGTGFAYRVSGCGSCCCRPSLLETCCGGCAGRVGSSFVVDLIFRGGSTRESATLIGLWPTNDRRGCCPRCWPHDACLGSTPCYLKLLAARQEKNDIWSDLLLIVAMQEHQSKRLKKTR